MQLPDSTGSHLEYKSSSFFLPLQNFLGLLRKLWRRKEEIIRKSEEKEENLFFHLDSCSESNVSSLSLFLSLSSFLLSGMTDPRGASVSRFPRRFFQLCRPLAGPPSRAKWIIDGTKQWRSFVPRASNVICSMQGLSVRQFCAHRVV